MALNGLFDLSFFLVKLMEVFFLVKEIDGS